MLNILIADDHRVLRESLHRVLDQEPDMCVAAEAQNGKEAVMLAKKMDIDLVLMDISMPELNGIDAAHAILKMKPSIKIVILSMHSNSLYVEDAFQSGAHGYLLKNCAISEVVFAIKTVSEGKRYISPDIAATVVEDFIIPTQKTNHPSSNELSQREQEVLRHLSDGKTTKEIASVLFLSDKTIEVHRKNIMKKLNCNTVAELIKKAICEGLITIERT